MLFFFFFFLALVLCYQAGWGRAEQQQEGAVSPAVNGTAWAAPRATAARAQRPYPSVALPHGSAALGATGTGQGLWAVSLILLLILGIVIRVRGKPGRGSIVGTKRAAPVLPSWMQLLGNVYFLTLLGSFATVSRKYIPMGISPNGDYNMSIKYC